MLKAKGKQVSLGVLLLTAVLFGVLGLGLGAVRATGTWTDLTEVTAAEGLTETDYQISDAAGLRQLAQWVNEGSDFAGITLHIVADIDLTGTDLSPIGTQTAGFAGTLTGLKSDGTAAALSGLTQTGKSYLGLFGLISEGGRVENLVLKNASVSGTDSVGLLAAQNNGVIENVTLTGGALTGSGFAGGLAGINNGTISGVTAESLSVTGNNSVGGLIGQNSGTLTAASTVGGSVSGSSTVGGLVGANYGTLSSSENGAAVTGTAGTAVSMVGGVAGSNSGILADVLNTGAVTVENGTLVGGIAGFNYNPDPEAEAVTAETAAAAPVRIENALNLGTVTSGADYTAGLVGRSETAALLKAYNAGAVVSAAEHISAGSTEENTAWASYTALTSLNGSMVYAEFNHGRNAAYGLTSFDGLSEETVTLSDENVYAASLLLTDGETSFAAEIPAEQTVAFERVDAEKEDAVVFMVFDLGEGEIAKTALFTIPTKDNEFTAEYTAEGYVLTGLNANYVNYTGTVTAIPASWTDNIHGQAPVVGIAAGAFAEAASAAQITLPESVTSLGGGAFPYGTEEGQTQLLILSSREQYDSLTAGLPAEDLTCLTYRILVILAPGGGTMPSEVSYQRLYDRPLNFALSDGLWQTDESFALPGASAVTRTGYTLTGWQSGGALFESGTLLLPEDETLTLTAAWALTAPVLGEIADVQAGYGQDPSVTVTASHDLAVSYAYAWYKLDADTEEYLPLEETSATLTLTDVADSGSYKVVVTATLGQDSASAEQTFEVTLDKAELTVVFSGYEGLTYDGTAKTISASFVGLAEGDEFTPVLTYDPAEVVNVGTYTATASLPEGAEANYTLTGTLTQAFTVARAELTVVFDDYDSLTYDGTAKTISASFVSLAEGDEFTPVLTYDPAEVINAGTYTATASLPEGAEANYTLTGTLTQEFTVQKAGLTVVFSDYDDLVYDGTAKTISATFSGLIEGDELTPVLTYDPAEVINAGDYTATASLPESTIAQNYTLTGTLTCEFTVAGAALTVVFDDYEGLIYDGTVQSITASFVGLGEGDEFVPVITYDREVKNAGTYTATASLPEGADNYALTGTVTCEFTIARAELTVVFSDTVKPYNGRVQSLTAAFAGLADGDELTPALTYDREPREVGFYTASASLPEDNELSGNYTLTGTLTAEFEITKASLTVQFNTVDLTYNGQDRKGDISASFVGLQNQDELRVVFSFSAEEVINAGTYTVTASLPEGAEINYTLTGETSLTFEIKKAPLTVTFTDHENLVYNAREQQISASLVGLVAGETLAPVLTYDREVLNAGDYTAAASLPEDEIAKNYTLTGDLTCEFTVARRDLTAGFAEMDLTYNGQDRRADINGAFLSGLQGADTLTLTLSFEQNGEAVSEVRNAGTYTVIASLPDSEVAKNYTLAGGTSLSREFEIARRVVGVELTGADGLVYDGTEKTVGVTFTNIVAGETLEPEWTFGEGVVLKNAGDYTLIVILPDTETAKNYTLSAQPTVVTIQQATLTVTFEGTEDLVYDGTEKTVTASASGFVEGEDFELILSGNTATAAGTYTAAVSLPADNALAANYQLDRTEQAYVIARRQITAVFVTEELPYSGADQSANVEVRFDNVVEGESVVYAVAADPAGFAEVGVYTLTVSLTDDAVNANYELTGTLTGTVEIVRKGLTVRYDTLTLTYTGQVQTLTASFEGLAEGESLTPVLSYSAEARDAGDYVVTAALPEGEVAANYYLAGSPTTGFTIRPAELTVTFEGIEGLVYDGSEKAVTAFFSGLVNGESLTPVLTFSGEVLAAGDYTVTAALPEGTVNYELTGTVFADFSVAKADPQVTLPAGLTATYGDTLADVVLPAGWTWTNASASVGNVGANIFEAVYTPGDTQNYNTLTADLTVTVGKAVAPAQPLDGLTAYYRDQLSDIRLPEGWSWADPEAEVGEIGKTQHLAIYHSEDGNYADAQVMLEVLVQARPFSCDGSVTGASLLLSALTLAGAALFLKRK